MVFEKIKILYPNLNELHIEIYKDMGIDLIYNYLISINIKIKKDDVETKYESVLLKVIINSIEAFKTNNVKQMSQGSKSVTYSNTDYFVITDDIKAMLPLPMVKMMG